jgi:hypothetical protein
METPQPITTETYESVRQQFIRFVKGTIAVSQRMALLSEQERSSDMSPRITEDQLAQALDWADCQEDGNEYIYDLVRQLVAEVRILRRGTEE